MKKNNHLHRLGLGAFVLLGWLALAVGLPVQAEAAVLQNADCIKCHEAQPREIAEKGRAHKTAIGCMDCHVGHPPAVTDIIPACSMCHAGTPHFELPNCSQCHTNAHTPLDLRLAGDLVNECLTCHMPIGQQLAAYPSAHKDVACNFCHADTHGYIPDCMQCHRPHFAQQTNADCASCHGAHKPLNVVYDDKLADVHCAACHNVAKDELLANPSKHQGLACVACHQEKHKMVPLCADCHGAPHAPGIHARFPDCGSCHNTAHDLVY
ncbi:cytochrome C [Geoalkalibacter halelectricus]|uniref:cytochrome C n=1 Tax=Geoalkalibacter halelectricus TaxID=2847045 RepID=UPI003D1C7A6A